MICDLRSPIFGLRPGRIDGLEGAGPGGEEVGEGVDLAVEDEVWFGGGVADELGIEGRWERFAVLDEEGEVAFGEEVCNGRAARAPLGFGESEVVTESHLGEGGGEAGMSDVMEG